MKVLHIGLAILTSAFMAAREAPSKAVPVQVATGHSKTASAGYVPYRVADRIRLGGEGVFWDYLAVDDSTDRIFVTRGTRVMVVDAQSGKLIGTLPGTRKVHAATVAADLGRVFVSNGIKNQVRVFDTKTLALVADIAVGRNPDAILYHPKTQRAFVSNGESNDVTVIDAAALKVLGTIEVGGKPEFSVLDAAGLIYVNVEDRNSIVVIDPDKMAVLKEWKLGKCDEPTGLAIDRDKGRLFSACANQQLAISDIAAGRVIDSAPIGDECDGVAFDTETRQILAANRDGTVTVIAEDEQGRYKSVQTLKTEPGGRTIAYDEKRHRALIPAGTYAPMKKSAPRPEYPPILHDSFSLIVVAPARE